MAQAIDFGSSFSQGLNAVLSIAKFKAAHEQDLRRQKQQQFDNSLAITDSSFRQNDAAAAQARDQRNQGLADAARAKDDAGVVLGAVNAAMQSGDIGILNAGGTRQLLARAVGALVGAPGVTDITVTGHDGKGNFTVVPVVDGVGQSPITISASALASTLTSKGGPPAGLSSAIFNSRAPGLANAAPENPSQAATPTASSGIRAAALGAVAASTPAEAPAAAPGLATAARAPQAQSPTTSPSRFSHDFGQHVLQPFAAGLNADVRGTKAAIKPVADAVVAVSDATAKFIGPVVTRAINRFAPLPSTAHPQPSDSAGGAALTRAQQKRTMIRSLNAKGVALPPGATFDEAKDASTRYQALSVLDKFGADAPPDASTADLVAAAGTVANDRAKKLGADMVNLDNHVGHAVAKGGGDPGKTRAVAAQIDGAISHAVKPLVDIQNAAGDGMRVVVPGTPRGRKAAQQALRDYQNFLITEAEFKKRLVAAGASPTAKSMTTVSGHLVLLGDDGSVRVSTALKGNSGALKPKDELTARRTIARLMTTTGLSKQASGEVSEYVKEHSDVYYSVFGAIDNAGLYPLGSRGGMTLRTALAQQVVRGLAASGEQPTPARVDQIILSDMGLQLLSVILRNAGDTKAVKTAQSLFSTRPNQVMEIVRAASQVASRVGGGVPGLTKDPSIVKAVMSLTKGDK